MNLRKLFKIITIITTILLTLIIIYFLHTGIFSNQARLMNYINSFGMYGGIVFILLQIIQVVFPVIPGGMSCLIGVLCFGPIFGFIFNYIGLTIGSILAYLLAKVYGISLIRKLFSPNTVDKYLKYINTPKFNKIFFLFILLPGLPDDLFCYIAGISKMNLSTFSLIILIAKPLTLIIYSLFVILI